MKKIRTLINFNQEGFSIIELCLVISILAIISVVAIPTDNDLTSFMNVDTASRTIKEHLRYAQNLALTTGNPHGFRSTGDTTYEVYEVETDTIVNSPWTNEPMQEDLEEYYRGMEFANNNYQIEFDSLGRPTTGGGTTVTLVGNDSYTQSIEISEESGFITLQSIQ